jgi:hypothetical protein
MKTLFKASVVMFLTMLVLMASARPNAAGSPAGGMAPTGNDYKILAPITQGDLTIFPVVSARVHDTSDFLTLDEGIRSGEVVVTEVGNIHAMIRRTPQVQRAIGGAEVNRLVLVNNSKHPLILLAGEVVTGGKQDRVVAKDRIVPAESDPVDLGVFCVEHGRWVESSTKFDTHASVMLQPSVRKNAMADKSQQKVWDGVSSAKGNMEANLRAAAPANSSGVGSGVGGGSGAGTGSREYAYAANELQETSSYAKARANKIMQKQVESITEPMQKSYESVIKQLRNQNAVGVVVAVKGHVVWADMFASGSLLGKYWPKLLESYATEALTVPGARAEASAKEAQEFLDNWQANHEIVDSEPGLYRQRELTGNKFKAFELTSLLPKENFDVHLSKMAE